MPAVDFDVLPADARVWVFASDAPLTTDAEATLLAAVDAFLAQWNAHGHPLRCAREWRDARFLAIGVDQSTAGASGCSIDGLFRTLQQLQSTIGASLLPAGRVYWREERGNIASGSRADFRRLAETKALTPETVVFDTTVTTADAWRNGFEVPARGTWHAQLMSRV